MIKTNSDTKLKLIAYMYFSNISKLQFFLTNFAITIAKIKTFILTCLVVFKFLFIVLFLNNSTHFAWIKSSFLYCFDVLFLRILQRMVWYYPILWFILSILPFKQSYIGQYCIYNTEEPSTVYHLYSMVCNSHHYHFCLRVALLKALFNCDISLTYGQ